MANQAFDATQDYQLAQDPSGVFYFVQNGNWYLQSTAAYVPLPIPNYKFVPRKRTILRLGAPLILVSSGSFANNGALSGITAIQSAYAQAWVGLPAGAIFAGSLAGTYLCKFSSTSAGQVFQDQPTVVNGVVQFPASPTPWVCTGPGAFTQATAAGIAMLSFTIPGFTVSQSGSFSIRALVGYNNSAGTKTFGISINGTNQIQVAGSTTAQTGILHDVVSRGVPSSLVSQPASATGLGAGAAVPLLTAADLTAVQSWVLSINLATATDYGQFEFVIIEADV